MKYLTIITTIVLIVNVVHSSTIQSRVNTQSCPCSDSSWCEPIDIGERPEFMGFSVSGNQNYANYDFSKITTLASFFGPVSSDLLCLAHSKGIRVVYGTSYPVAQLGNWTFQEEWIQQQVDLVQSTYADGLNFDVEDPIYQNSSDISALYTGLVAETNYVFKKLNPNYQITVDVAWSPNCIDGRCYDYQGLAQASDYLVAMDYDMQSQMFTETCLAAANSPTAGVIQGMQAFFDLGIPASKLVMGLPFYGYRYTCIGSSASLNNPVCQIKLVPFRGVNCSDAAGSQLTYSTILSIIQDPTIKKSSIQWDSIANAPFFNYIDSNGLVNQMRFDNAQSLQDKVNIAQSLSLRGMAVWNIDQLGPLNQTEYSDLWNSINSFFN
ncbi:hypothetical protein CYY_000198 [Polysphondylium violaceum]|uniref:GH18 domain-containing protein n=1 Tax=Polysphondylium violaceum TaxID=133409 RepID=A0A8J4V5V0_9MYCE|nr:hypothetical protein CYY_000198 [Polysphondylium violaceum]